MFNTPGPKVREAKPEDYPAVIKVILAAINKERLWQAFVPAKGSQDSAYQGEIEALLKEHLDPSNKDWVIEVVDAAGKGEPAKIVAVSVWDVSSGRAGESKREFLDPSFSSVLDLTTPPNPSSPLFPPLSWCTHAPMSRIYPAQ